MKKKIIELEQEIIELKRERDEYHRIVKIYEKRAKKAYDPFSPEDHFVMDDGIHRIGEPIFNRVEYVHSIETVKERRTRINRTAEQEKKERSRILSSGTKDEKAKLRVEDREESNQKKLRKKNKGMVFAHYDKIRREHEEGQLKKVANG